MICIIFIISLLLIPVYYRFLILGVLPKYSDVINEAEDILRNNRKGKL